jgi:hypothetical protein
MPVIRFAEIAKSGKYVIHVKLPSKILKMNHLGLLGYTAVKIIFKHFSLLNNEHQLEIHAYELKIIQIQ